MAKGYKKTLVRSQKECKRLRRDNKQLKHDLFMEESSSAARWGVIKAQSVRINELTMKKNGKQSLLMYSLEVLKDCQREAKTYKFGLATSGCVIVTLICVIIYLLG